MMSIYEGRPGAGKSYHAVKDMAMDLAMGSIVHTNLFIHREKMVEYCYRKWSVTVPLDSIQYHEDGAWLAQNLCDVCPMGTRTQPNKIYLDEAHCWFNSRDWRENHERLKRQFLWMTQHRKFHIDLVFITQDANNIDAQFRRLAQYYKRYRDLARVKVPIFGEIYPLPHTLEILLDYDGKTIMGRNVVPRSKDIYDLYESEQLLMSAGFEKKEQLSKITKDTRKQNRERMILVGNIAIVLALIVEGYMMLIR